MTNKKTLANIVLGSLLAVGVYVVKEGFESRGIASNIDKRPEIRAYTQARNELALINGYDFARYPAIRSRFVKLEETLKTYDKNRIAIEDALNAAHRYNFKGNIQAISGTMIGGISTGLLLCNFTGRRKRDN